MTVVSDTSVLIFLAKIKKLDLLHQLFSKPLVITEEVREEILGKNDFPEEQDSLHKLIASWKIIKTAQKHARSAGLSPADWSVLEAAQDVKADLVLADERVLRQLLTAKGFQIIGTLELLLLAHQNNLLTKAEVKTSVNKLIQFHRFRISSELYRAFLHNLDLL